VRDAYRQWCIDRSVTPMIQLVGTEGARSAAVRLLDRLDRPDAVLALAEGYGPAVLNAAAELRVAVPDDLLVACGVDSPRALAVEIPLTAVALAPELQGRAAVDLLLERLAGGVGGPVVIQPKLEIRRSSIGLRARGGRR